MTFKITDNQYGQLFYSDSWASCWLVFRCITLDFVTAVDNWSS